MEWSDLPTDLLLTIAGYLLEYTDHIRFCYVCSSWHFALKSLPLPPKLPWLILPLNYSGHLYSFSEDRVYPYPLSDAKNTSFIGSASGWLLAFKGQGQTYNFTSSIVNPFTGASIGLPCPKLYSFLSEVTSDTLLWDRSESIVVVGCRTRNGVFYTHISGGKTFWKRVDSLNHIEPRSITFYKSKFYILSASNSKVYVLDGESPEVVIRVINCNRTHLVMHFGGSLLLLKSHGWEDDLEYMIYEIDLNKELEEWRVVDDIGHHAIFMDELHCFLVEVDEKNKLTRNCIYKADSKTKVGLRWPKTKTIMYTISVFNLKNWGRWEREKCAMTIREFHVGPHIPSGKVCPPTWILPSLI